MITFNTVLSSINEGLSINDVSNEIYLSPAKMLA